MTNKSKKISETKILLQLLKNVPFDGWTWDALYNSAVDLKMFKSDLTEKDKSSLRDIYDNKMVNAIKKFNDYLDDEMKKKFKKTNLVNQKIPVKIKNLIMFRLNSSYEYKDAIRSSIGIMSFPRNSKFALKMLYKTCDDIWRTSNDKSTDFSFYTKRLVLSGVYTSTLFYWLNENNIVKVENFLDRRLNDIHRFGKIKSLSSGFPNLLNKTDDIIRLLRNLKNNRFSYKSSE